MIHTTEHGMRQDTLRSGQLSDQALAGQILGELKRIAAEYVTAAMEATAADVRSLFRRLANRTLDAQMQLAEAMTQNQLLEAAFPAPQQELQKAAQKGSETLRSAQQLWMNGATAYAPQHVSPFASQITPQPALQQTTQHSMHPAMQSTGQYAPQPATQYIAHYAPQPALQQMPQYAQPPAPQYISPYIAHQQAQPPFYQPTQTGGGSGAYRQAQPLMPEFAQPHASPFGGLPQAHYAPIRPTYANANLTAHEPYEFSSFVEYTPEGKTSDTIRTDVLEAAVSTSATPQAFEMQSSEAEGSVEKAAKRSSRRGKSSAAAAKTGDSSSGSEEIK